MLRGDIANRLDPHFHLPIFTRLVSKIRRQPSEKLGNLVSLSSETREPTNGTFRYIEISAVGVGSDEYTTEEIPANEAPSRARMVVRENDILISKTRPHRGAIAKVRGEDDQCIASTGFAIVRELDTRLNRTFLLNLLLSGIALRQFERYSAGSGYPAIVEGDIKEIVIPLPVSSVQKNLVTVMQDARERRAQRLREADAELAGMDAFLLDALRLNLVKADARSTYAVRSGQLLWDKHFDADYYSPERILAIRAARQHGEKGLHSARLQDIVHFIRDQVPADSHPNYLGLASVQSNTGELIRMDEEVTGDCSAFSSGDVLFARLRPYLNKVHCAEHEGICSPEFYVMRLRSVAEVAIEVIPDYLATVLRSSLVLAQTRHMMTGNTHPRLANEDIANLVVPIPKDRLVQETISLEVKRRRERARTLREEAAREWEAAKAAFERRLLGGEA